MKFSAVVAFAAGALAAGPIVARQTPGEAIAANVATIASNTEALNTQVVAFTGTTDEVLALQAASQTLIESIQSATDALPTETLDDVDAVPLTQPFTDLRDQVETSISNVIDKKQAFDDAGVAAIVYNQLTQIRAASQELSDGILAIISDNLQTIAQGLSAPILSTLDEGVAAFEEFAGGNTDTPSETSAVETSAEPTATATETVTETEASTTAAPTVIPTGTGAPTSAPTTATYDPNAAVPTAAAVYGAMGLAALAAVAAF